jgi:hypothetical protein
MASVSPHLSVYTTAPTSNVLSINHQPSMSYEPTYQIPTKHFNIFEHLNLKNIILLLTIIAIILVLLF